MTMSCFGRSIPRITTTFAKPHSRNAFRGFNCDIRPSRCWHHVDKNISTASFPSWFWEDRIRPFATIIPGDSVSSNEINENETASKKDKSCESRKKFSMIGPSSRTTTKVTNRATVIEPSIRGKPFPKREKSITMRRILVNTQEEQPQQKHNHSRRRHRHRHQQQQQTTIPNRAHGTYPVVAIQVARSIDLSKVISKVFATRGVRKMRERLSVVAQLQPDTLGSTRFVAVFRFGSVVYFNVSPKEIATLTEEIKGISNGILDRERKDRFCVHVQPPHWSNNDNNDTLVDEVTADYCIVPELNMKSVDVISNIMAQSVALDAYNDTVEDLLADFESINHNVTVEGNTSAIDRDKLFRAVAQNNAIFLKLTKVGIKDRIDTAWNLSQYESVSEGMREEFDIDRRFEHIEFKLNLIQQNAKFFLEVLANQKSDSLEWIIIVLILLECILMCIEMSGMGGPLFAYLGKFVP